MKSTIGRLQLSFARRSSAPRATLHCITQCSKIELGINSRFCRWIFGCHGTSLTIGPFATMTKVWTGAGVPALESPPFARGTHENNGELTGGLGRHSCEIMGASFLLRLLVFSKLHLYSHAASENMDAHVSPRRRGGRYRTGLYAPE